MLEKEIEAQVCKYAKTRGWLTYKFTSPNRRSVPDRLFVSPIGLNVFIEFKQEGKKPTPAQDREIARLIKQQALVHIVDNVADGKLLVDLYET